MCYQVSISKVFERLMQSQIISHIEKFLSPYLCGYRKGYSAQNALLCLIEKWKTSIDKGGYAGAIMMDLSKAFDTLTLLALGYFFPMEPGVGVHKVPAEIHLAISSEPHKVKQ